MNLIEQYGGYNEAKEQLNKLQDTPNDAYSWSRFIQAENIKQALLEYRREHKFYEVGDKVFCEHFEMDDNKELLTVEIVRGGYLQLSRGIGCTVSLVRHATDEEIATGKRL